MAKKSTQNDTLSQTKQRKTAPKSTAKAKEPLVSTGKKVGIAIYFTFIATLAGVIGLQMLINQNFGEPMTTTDTYSTTVVDSQQPSTDSASTFSDFPIDEKAPRHNVAEPFDSSSSAPAQTPDISPASEMQSISDASTTSQNSTSATTRGQQADTITLDSSACPDGNCDLTTFPAPQNQNVAVDNTCPDGDCVCTDGNCDCPDGDCATAPAA